MGFWKRCLMFCLGGSAYVGLEFLWRGRSHSSMFFLGGACFLVIGKLSHILERTSAFVRALAYGASVTALELATGLVVNRRHRVWDYRDIRWNYRGQICLLYSLLWMPVSLFAGALYRITEKRLSGKGDAP